MKKKESFIQDIKIIYAAVKRNVTVFIGTLAIAACSIATTAIPVDLRIEPISPIHTELISESRLPDNVYNSLFGSIRDKAYQATMAEEWDREISELAELGDDWDAEGAAAVQPEAVQLCRDIISETQSALSSLTEIYPTPFGSLCMEWKIGPGYVNAEVSAAGISFFHNYRNGYEKYIRELGPASAEAISDLKTHLA